jgi:hypothetical protein
MEPINCDYPFDRDYYERLWLASYWAGYSLMCLQGIGREYSSLLACGAIPFLVTGTKIMNRLLTIPKEQTEELRAYYLDFIEDYKKFNQSLGLTNPVDITLFYQQMLDNGYLSHNHRLQIVNDKNCTFHGLSVLKGNVVCRHVAALLTSILNGVGVEAWELKGKLDYKMISIIFDDYKHNKADIIKRINDRFPDDSVLKNKLVRLINSYSSDNYCSVNIDLGKINPKGVPNHAITYFTDQQNGYYYDALNHMFFVIDPTNPRLLYDVEGLGCAFYIKGTINEYETSIKKPKVSELLRSSKMTASDYEAHEDKMASLFVQNQDMAEKFYQDHEELYDEIAIKLSRVNRICKKL